MQIRFVFVLASLCWLISCQKQLMVSKIEKTQYVLGANHYAMEDSILLKTISPWRDSLNKTMGTPVAIASDPFMDIELSNLCADAMLAFMEKHPVVAQPKIDFIVLNREGLRTTLPKGEISQKSIYELMPFDNTLVILKLKGDDVAKILKLVVSRKTEPVARLSVQGQSEEILINGIPFDEARTYQVATLDYLAKGGFGFPVKPEEYFEYGMKVRDAMIQYLTEATMAGDTLTPNYEVRIKP